METGTASAPTPTADTSGAIKDGETLTSIRPPISVLIVENNRINQAILAAYMRKRKIQYATADNGQEAVERWQTGHYDIIIMNIQLPVMDGIQATKEIRRLEKSSPAPPTGNTPFANSQGDGATRSSVIIFAHITSSFEADRAKAIEAGCNDLLIRPISLPLLDKKISEW
ncbi:CheY-like protein, partial [Clavulina sp. PMI_390]